MKFDFEPGHQIVLDTRHTFVSAAHTTIRASIIYLQKYRNVTPFLSYVHLCVLSSQTASYEKNSVRQTFNLSWRTSQKERFAYHSPLTITWLIFLPIFMLPFVGLTRWGCDLSSLVLCMLKSCAVHAGCCVMGEERVVFRRGIPAVDWSSNGTNIIGGKKELQSCIEKSRNFWISPWNFRVRAFSTSSIHPVHHTKMAPGRGWSAVLREYCTSTSADVTWQMKFWTLLIVKMNTNWTHVR